MPWVSTDAAENEDNNDPNWEILQKLSTDEERYRVVREKWQQLEIPDPRRDLTCNNFWKSQPHQVSFFFSKLYLYFALFFCPLNCLSKCSLLNFNIIQMRPNHDMQLGKRGRSPDKTQDDAQPNKRRRIMSCTDLFHKRIKDLKRDLDERNLALKARFHKELNNLSIQQQEEHDRYYRSSAPPHILTQQLMDLQHHQEKV